MTEIKLTANIKYPTKKINEESIQPLLKEFQKQLKEFMKKNLPPTKKVVITPVKKKDLINVKLPEDYVKTLCGICDSKFKTAHKQKYCANCRLTMVRQRISSSALYVKLHPNIKATYKSLDDRLKNVSKLIEEREEQSLLKKIEYLELKLEGIEKFKNKTLVKPSITHTKTYRGFKFAGEPLPRGFSYEAHRSNEEMGDD